MFTKVDEVSARHTRHTQLLILKDENSVLPCYAIFKLAFQVW